MKFFTKSYWAEFFFPKQADELQRLRDEIVSLKYELSITSTQKSTLLAIINGAVKPELRPQSAWISSDTDSIQHPPAPPKRPEIVMRKEGSSEEIPLSEWKKRKSRGGWFWFTTK